MPDAVTIDPTPVRPPGMDYALLRAEGMALLQQLSGARWTELNSSDPGVTLLETLCYALTDVCFRIDSATRALAAPTDEIQALPDHVCLPPERLLPTQPVTLEDWRQVLLDWRGTGAVAGERLRDVVVRPWGGQDGRGLPCGLYEVLIEFEKAGLNRFVHRTTVGFADGVVGGSAIDEKQTMQITGSGFDPKSIVEGGHLPFTVHFIGAAMEVEFPPWDDPAVLLPDLGPWFDPNATLTVTDSKATQASEDRMLVNCVVSVRLNNQSVELPVSARIVSDIAANTDPLVAMEHLMLSDGGQQAVSDFKERMTKVGLMRQQLTDYLNARRNLCEAFPREVILEDSRVLPLIRPFKVVELGLEATLRVKPSVEMREVLTALHRHIQERFSPRVIARSPTLKRRDGLSIPDAFEGPVLANADTDAVIPPRVSAAPAQQIAASDLIQMLMSIDGVRAVDLASATCFRLERSGIRLDVFFRPGIGEAPGTDFAAEVAEEERLRLSTQPSRVKLSFVYVDEHGVESQPKLLDDVPAPTPPTSSLPLLFPSKPPLFDWSARASYPSVQEEFPQIYGLSSPATVDATDLRERQIAQLRGYLTLFDQMLSAACQQTASLPALLGKGEPLAQALPLDSFGVASLLAREATLQDMANQALGITDAQKARLLEHLLARQGQPGHEGISQKGLLVESCDLAMNRFAAARDARGLNAFARRIALLAGLSPGDVLVSEGLREFADNDGRTWTAIDRANALELLVVVSGRIPAETIAKVSIIAQREAPAHLHVSTFAVPNTEFGIATEYLCRDTPGDGQPKVFYPRDA